MAPQHRVSEERSDRETDPRLSRIATDECLVIRNYDGATNHDVSVTFVNAQYETVFDRTLNIDPLETTSIAARLQRGVYRVIAEVDSSETDSAECLIGSGPEEVAVVEMGNGTVTVVDGHY